MFYTINLFNDDKIDRKFLQQQQPYSSSCYNLFIHHHHHTRHSCLFWTIICLIEFVNIFPVTLANDNNNFLHRQHYYHPHPHQRRPIFINENISRFPMTIIRHYSLPNNFHGQHNYIVHRFQGKFFLIYNIWIEISSKDLFQN